MIGEFEGVATATLKEWLANAQLARQNLLTGRGTVEVMTDGYLARFARMTPPALLAYIGRLGAEIARRGGADARSGGIGVLFA